MATTSVTTVVDEELSEDAAAVLASIGMTVDQAVRLLLTQVVRERCLPAAMHVPNQETIEAMREADRGEGERFESVEALFTSLGI